MQISTIVRRLALLFLSMVFSLGFAIAQEKTVTGKVTADQEGPLPGVNVTVQGTTTGVMTDAGGSYSLKVPGPNAVLVFSSIGYVSQNIPVGSQTTIDVVLVSDVQALQEVVVTGYSTQRKRDLTGSVGVVEPSKLTSIPTGNVTNQLQGQTSGLSVVGNGQPGETSRVRIRGFSSFENNDPLYIVDGVPTQDISTLNPNDIEALSVLKDAGAASVYGSRASNGVIIVTTKKGGNGIKVTYDMYYGTQFPGTGTKDVLANAHEMADIQWLVYRNDGTSETHPLYGPSSNATPTVPTLGGPETDWYAAITHNAPIQNHDFSFSGGNDNAKFFAGAGIFDQQGIILHTDAKRYTGRFNSEFKFLNQIVTFGENFTASYNTSHGVANLEEGSPIQMGPYREQPIIPIMLTQDYQYSATSRQFKTGEFGGTGMAPRLGNASNAYANLFRGKDNNNWGIRMIGSAFVDIKILQGLNFRSTLGGTWNNGYGVNYNMFTYENAENTATSNLSESAYWGSDWVLTNTLTYNKAFGTSRINAVGGYESVKYGIGRNVSGARAGYFSDNVDFRTLNNGATLQGANSDNYTPTTLVSLFVKADYALADKYLFSATVRRDGSSRFGADNRYGVFPSFSLGWRVGEESFLSGLGWLNEFKIRGSYGTMGNQLAISPMNAFFLYGGDPGNSFYDINGTFTGSEQGFRLSRIGNSNAKWETNITTNIGFEAQLFDSKWGIVFDWYSKKTKDLLFNPELPGTSGDASQPYINIASMSNSGVDMELTYKNMWGDFGFNGSAVFTSYKNDITAISEGVNFFDWGGSRIGGFVRNEVGHPMSSFFGYEVQGLFQTAAEVSEAATQDGAEPGFFRYKDIDGSGTIDPKDRTFIGNPNPNFTYGLNLGFTWKNFDLSTFLFGSQGNDIFNWNTWWINFWPSFQGVKSKDLLNNSWTADRTNATVPKASNKSNFSTNTVPNSYYLEDGSYLKMKTLRIGYNIPASVLDRINVGSLRVYLQAVNPITITKYSGLDPEIGGEDRNFGVDYGNYPNVKQFIFGLNIVL
ncbi:MAG: SusC/RagA family TonB-linked outer membrane protein [Chloroflexota bacterium]